MPHLRTALIIPALNEEAAIGRVLTALPGDVYSQVIVADNGSADRTASVAVAHGATVVHEPRRGYGNACLAALKNLDANNEIVVFMDGDGSDNPAEVTRLIAPIAAGEADFVVGSRELGERQPDALTPHQRLGNKLVVWLIRLFYGHRYTDLGPFRAVRLESLRSLAMRDPDYGWTIEMQVKALKKRLRVVEVPVSARRRIAGQSKVSGNLRGSIAAGAKILWTFARLTLSSEPLEANPQVSSSTALRD